MNYVDHEKMKEELEANKIYIGGRKMNVTPFLKESNLKVYKDTIFNVKKIEEQGNWYIITTDEGEVEWIDSDEYQLVVWNSET